MSATNLTLPAGLTGRDQAATLRGLGFVLFAMVVLPGQDAVAKYLSSDLSPGEISWMRFLLQTVLTVPFLWYFHGWSGFWPVRPWENALRGALISVGSLLFFAAVKLMPIADALAIFFIEPFILIILAAIIDKEQIGWALRIAVATGFLGVLLVVQPSYKVFGAVSLLPAIAGCIFAVYIMLSRRVSLSDTPLAMQFAAGVSASVVLGIAVACGSAFGLTDFTLHPLDSGLCGLLLLMGLLGTTGHFAFVIGSRLAPASVVAPLQYVEIVTAVVLG